MSTADIVHEWFRQRLQCGALARDTEAYTQVRAELPDLIARLEPIAPDGPATAAPAPAAPAVKAAKVLPDSPAPSETETGDPV